jgi:hypothetical protein
MPNHSSRRGGRPPARSNAVVWWAVGGGGAVFLLVGGVTLALLLLTGGPSEFPEAPPNPNVTAENFDRLRYGSTFAKVKQTLGGGGRPLTDTDLDILCHRRFVYWVNQRQAWKASNSRGEMRIWESGRLRIVCRFHRPPEDDGQVIGLVIAHPDGRSGGQFDSKMPDERTLRLLKDEELRGR